MNLLLVVFLVFLPAFETTNRTACLPEVSIREFVKFWEKYEEEWSRCQGGQCLEEDKRSRNGSKCDIQEIKLQVETTLNNFKDEMRQLVLNLTNQFQHSIEKEEKKLTCLQKYKQDVVTLGNGKSYHFSTVLKNWYQAKDYCVEKGMRLASPKTQEELNILHGKIRDIEDGNFWLSASDVGRKGIEFRWLDGEVVPISSSLWAKESKQPDHFGDGHEACAFISKYTESNKLLDHECRTTSVAGSICEAVDCV
ncbi:C-type lectin domain family 4 member F-like [Cloeon dipterum]|uniref:C-type lectin domain family 4 member F-like n=1 Tax=Cloeon dipterum TaxID=197152 RepID=UPI0032207994